MPCLLQIDTVEEKRPFLLIHSHMAAIWQTSATFGKKGKNAFFSFFLTTFSLECSNSTDYITYPSLEDTFSEGY